MGSSPRHAQSRLEFIPQKFNVGILYLTQLLLPLMLRLRLRPWLPSGISKVETVNAEKLAELYYQFQQGKIRFLIAFRHPEVDDPLSMFYLVSRAVARAARQHQIPLKRPIHSHFIYDRGMTLWAGNWLGFFFSRLGGIPIHRGKSLDRTGIKAARNLFMNGRFPIAVAPEGATNGHSEIVSPLEPGAAQMGFWCLDDLAKANRTEQVWIVPIAVQYYYPKAPWKKLDKLLSQLEADSGLAVQPIAAANSENRELAYYQRLLRLADHLLSLMEQFYRRFYRQTIHKPEIESEPTFSYEQRLIIARLQNLLDIALKVAEQHFGLQSNGTVIERCRRLEEAGWNVIFREDIPDVNAISPFERGLADWAAEEADLRMRHMRLVESFVAITDAYGYENLTVERFAERVLIMFDLVSRIKGEKMPRRPRLGWRHSRVTVGDPISVSDRASFYKSSHKAAKQAVKDLTNDLQQSLEKLIVSNSTP